MPTASEDTTSSPGATSSLKRHNFARRHICTRRRWPCTSRRKEGTASSALASSPAHRREARSRIGLLRHPPLLASQAFPHLALGGVPGARGKSGGASGPGGPDPLRPNPPPDLLCPSPPPPVQSVPGSARSRRPGGSSCPGRSRRSRSTRPHPGSLGRRRPPSPAPTGGGAERTPRRQGMAQGAGRADPQEASDGGAVGPRGRQRSPRGGIGSDGHMMAQRSDPRGLQSGPRGGVRWAYDGTSSPS